MRYTHIGYVRIKKRMLSVSLVSLMISFLQGFEPRVRGAKMSGGRLV